MRRIYYGSEERQNMAVKPKFKQNIHTWAQSDPMNSYLWSRVAILVRLASLRYTGLCRILSRLKSATPVLNP